MGVNRALLRSLGAGVRILEEYVGAHQRVNLAQWPTPVHLLPRLSEQLGLSIYCKREDLSGFGFGGNKVRKLEFIAQEALDQGANTLVTCGSNQSNWCRMTAAVGAALGLKVHLVLGGKAPETLTGNLVLSSLAGASLHHFETDDDNELECISEELTEELSGQGERPFRILMGGSNGLGTLGYIDAFREILEYESESGIGFGSIVFATGSGGTQAGLVVGQRLSGWPGRVIGMTASRSSDAQVCQVRHVIERFDELHDLKMSDSAIIAEDAYVGQGYREMTRDCAEAIRLFARSEGIFLDEVYTGKAAAGLIDYARKGRFNRDENVLFLHTGGSPQLFE